MNFLDEQINNIYQFLILKHQTYFLYSIKKEKVFEANETLGLAETAYILHVICNSAFLNKQYDLILI
jgi:wobble nucleotide-excising tRNase